MAYLPVHLVFRICLQPYGHRQKGLGPMGGCLRHIGHFFYSWALARCQLEFCDLWIAAGDGFVN